MSWYTPILRKRFTSRIMRSWKLNNHDLKNISCVYIMVSLDPIYKLSDIVYIGSTTQLCNRYRSHKIPEIIQETGNINLMYFMPMDKGFYDYEIKLIRKLQPVYNKQHKNGS